MMAMAIGPVSFPTFFAVVALLTFASFASGQADARGPEAAGPSFSRSTRLPLADVLLLIEDSAARQGFRIIAQHDLQASLKKEGFERDAYTVVELCSAEAASTVLREAPTVGSLLPCRIAAYRQGDQTVLATTLPSALMGLVVADKPEMGVIARQIDQAMIQVIEDATQAKALTLQTLWNATHRAYKVALIETGTEQPDLARGALADASARWKTFVERFGAKPPAPYGNDAAWGADLSAVAGAFAEAKQALFEGKTSQAHEALEAVRRQWMAIRVRNGVDWFADRVTRYHDAMEPMLSALKDTQGPATPEQAQRIAAQLPIAEKEWASVVSGADKGNPKLKSVLDETTKTLQALGEALRTREFESVAKLAKSLKPQFIKLFLKFG